MDVQFSGTTWNSFSHRKRKVPRLACQSSFSPQNRGQLYLSTPWVSAWSKDANLWFQSAARWRSSCHGFAALCRVVSEADNCACSNAPGHLKSERPRPRQGALLKKHGGNLKESPPLMEPGSLCVCVGGWVVGRRRQRDRIEPRAFPPLCWSTTEQPSQELYLYYVIAAASYLL